MSRPSSARHPSPTTLAAAAAHQAADAMPCESALHDGVLLVLSYDGDNIFVLANSSYEHVLDSALANFSGLRKADRSQLRLALQTTIGSNETLVYITRDTWPAVASRAKVVTVLFQRSSPTLSHPSPNLAAKRPPSVTHRVASPAREFESASWTDSPPGSQQGTSWHRAYPPSAAYSAAPAQPAASPTSAPAPARTHSHSHSRQPSQPGPPTPGPAHFPYAHIHHLPAPPSVVSPTTDLSFIGVRALTDAEVRQERSAAHSGVPAKRHWDHRDDAGSDERTSYTRPAPEPSPAAQPEPARSREFTASTPHHHEDGRKQKRSRTWNPPDHQYSCRRCHRTDSPAWRKGPDGPKTLCNACGLSYAKELARREAANTAATTQQQQQQQPTPSPPEQPAGYGYPPSSATHAPTSRSGRATGVKTLDGSDATLPGPESSFQSPSGSAAQTAQPLRACTVCKRTDSPQWRKGPSGPNTLCNSCGLAWARTQRKSEGSRPGSSRSPSPTGIAPTYHQAAAAPPPPPAGRSPNGHIRSPSAGSLQRAESPDPDSQSELP